MLETRDVAYQRRKNNPLQDQSRPSKPPERDYQIARSIKPNTEIQQSDFSTSNSLKMKLDVTGWFNNAKALVPIIELEKIPSMKHQIKEVLGLEVKQLVLWMRVKMPLLFSKPCTIEATIQRINHFSYH